MELGNLGLCLLKHSEKKGDYQDFCPFETAADPPPPNSAKSKKSGKAQPARPVNFFSHSKKLEKKIRIA